MEKNFRLGKKLSVCVENRYLGLHYLLKPNSMTKMVTLGVYISNQISIGLTFDKIGFTIGCFDVALDWFTYDDTD